MGTDVLITVLVFGLCLWGFWPSKKKLRLPGAVVSSSTRPQRVIRRAPPSSRQQLPFLTVVCILVGRAIGTARRTLPQAWQAGKSAYQQARQPRAVLSSTTMPAPAIDQKMLPAPKDFGLGTGNWELGAEPGTGADEASERGLTRGQVVAIQKWKADRASLTKSDIAALIGGRKQVRMDQIDEVEGPAVSA